MAGYLFIGDLFKTSEYSNVINIKSEAEEIIIKKSGSEIKLFKKDGKWLVGKNSYPADQGIVKTLVEKLKELKISDQISKGDFASKYDLDPDKAVDIKITFENKVQKIISAGKKSSTNNHIYIKADGKPEIYLAAGNLDSAISKSEDDFRSREIFRIPSDSVSLFEINYKGKKFSFIKKTVEKTENVQVADGKPAVDDKKIKTDSWVFIENENIKLDTEKVAALISDFNPLRAASFIYDEKKLSNPIVSIKIKSAGKDFELAVFEKNMDKYPARSSESVYLFNLDDLIVKKYFIENIEGLKAPLK
jgi:hypothetical protein